VAAVITGTGSLFVDRTRSGKSDWSPEFPVRVLAPLKHPQASSVSIQIILDNNFIEVFAEDGETVQTNLIYPDAASRGVAFYAVQTLPDAVPARVSNEELVSIN
jgi:sucrose-6-phosphate hydrolase SacC (GH32 family)